MAPGPIESRTEGKLWQRVTNAAQQALTARKYVSAIDVLQGMGWLSPAHVSAWRTGRVSPLEAGIQTAPEKVGQALHLFRTWAAQQGLQPSETVYQRASRDGSVTLQFSTSAAEEVERTYRTHYVSPELTPARRAKMAERGAEPSRVVFEMAVL